MGLGMMGYSWDYAKRNELHRDLGDMVCVRRQRPQKDSWKKKQKNKNRRKTERPTLVPAESELEVGLEVRKDRCS